MVTPKDNKESQVGADQSITEISLPLKRKQREEKVHSIAVSIVGLSIQESPEKKISAKRQKIEPVLDLVRELLIHQNEELPPEFHSTELEIQGNWSRARLLPLKGENKPKDFNAKVEELFSQEVNLSPALAFEHVKDLERTDGQEVKGVLLDYALEKGYQISVSLPHDEFPMRDQGNVWVIVHNLIESNHLDKAKEIIHKQNLKLDQADQIKLLKVIARTSPVEECLVEFKGLFVANPHSADAADTKFNLAMDLALIFVNTGRYEKSKEFIKVAGPFIYKLPNDVHYADPQKTEQIVTIYAKGNEIHNALILAKKINDHRYRASAFITIIEEEAHHKPQVATKMALEMFIYEKDKFFKRDTMVLDMDALRNAKKVKFDYQNPINGVSYAVQALVRIAKVEETHQLKEEAFETIKLIFPIVHDHQDEYQWIDQSEKLQLCSEVISTIASLGFYQEAMDAARSLELNASQAGLVVAEELVKQYKNRLSVGDFEQAQKIKTMGLPLIEHVYMDLVTSNPFQFSDRETLKEIASLNAEFGGKREISTLPSDTQDLKFNQLLESAEVIKLFDPKVAKNQLERSISELSAIEMPNKTPHFVTIIKVMASIDFHWAWDQTERVPEDYRDSCLIELVKLKCETNLAMGVFLASSTKFGTEKSKAQALAETLRFFKQ